METINPKITADPVQFARVKVYVAQHGKVEVKMQESITGLINTQVRHVQSVIREAYKKSPEAMAQVGEEIVEYAFRPREWDAALRSAVRPYYAAALVVGAMTENSVFRFVNTTRLNPRLQELVDEAKSYAVLKEPENLEELYGVLEDLVEMPPNLQSSIDNHLAEVFDKSDYWEGINNTTKDEISRAIGEGVKQELSPWRLSKLIAAKVGGDHARMRGRRIARTETTGAFNAGHTEAIKELAREGMVEGKEWLATFDDFTRFTHMDAHGQQVRADAMFLVGGWEAEYAGDYGLPPEERINCRCTVTSVFGDGKQGVHDDQLEGRGESEEEALDRYNDELYGSSTSGINPLATEYDSRYDIAAYGRYGEMPYEEAMSQADELLEAKRQAVLTSNKSQREAIDNQIAIAKQEFLDADMAAVAADERQLAHVMVEDGYEAGSMGNEIRYRPILEREKTDAWRAQYVAMDDEIKEAVRRRREAAVKRATLQVERENLKNKALVLPKKDRTKVRTHVISKDNRAHKGAVLEPTNKKKMRANLKEVTDWLGDTMNYEAHKGTAILDPFYEGAPSKTKWHYKDGQFWIGIGRTKTGRAFMNSGDVYLAENSAMRVYAHEVGHTIETFNPRVKELTNAFIKKRTHGGANAAHLHDVFPDWGFSKLEITQGDDNWAQTVKGIITNDDLAEVMPHYMGRTYADGDTEIMSVGLELLFTDPERFAQNDPEYFKLIVGILDGTLL